MAVEPIIFPEGQDVFVKGNLNPRTMSYPANSITNAAVSSTAGIETNKLRHRFRSTYSQPNTAATAEVRVLHVVRLPGLIRDVKVGSVAAAIGDSTTTVDVKKNGVTVLTATVVLDNANTARVVEAGTVDSAVDDVVAGDVIEAVITISAGTGTLPTGVFVSIEVDEDGQ